MSHSTGALSSVYTVPPSSRGASRSASASASGCRSTGSDGVASRTRAAPAPGAQLTLSSPDGALELSDLRLRAADHAIEERTP